jgi:hypothetical protein
MPVEARPYVVSSDVRGLMGKWGVETGYQVPSDDFFQGVTNNLHAVLEGYFPGGIEIIDEARLKNGINRLAAQREHLGYVRHDLPIPIISLDRAYVDHTTPNILGHLDITRGVDDGLNDIGLMPRPDARDVKSQLDHFRSDYDFPVILLDDVIFTAGGMHWLIEELAKRNRTVVKIIAGIGIRSEGFQALRNLVDVECVREYDGVVDEVCQRDFIAGVPMSGRTVYHSSGEISSAPYFKPFGDAEKWASIPGDKIDEFSDFCMDTSIEVFRRVEHESGRSVSTSSISRLPTGTRQGESFPTSLGEFKKNK